MENIIGIAKSFLEERGIDTSNMTLEEIIEKYNDAVEDVKEEVQKEAGKSELDVLLKENEEIIASLNEEQKMLFDRLIEMAR